ncbi:MAG: DUF4377 domain-containing protein [Prevotellaceae bacterium]|nr:DUF4377 domain-containing protein [Prevotellaceae bacterium]
MRTKHYLGKLSTFFSTSMLIILTGILCVSCDNDDASGDTYADITMQVSETTVWESIWGSDTPTEHMLVKEQSATEWQRLPIGSIEGFENVQGHAYELKVRKTILANPPQDGTNCTYRLLEIISDTQRETPDTPEDWPEEARFKLKMVQLKPFMDLDTPLAAPFDMLIFRIFDYKDEYTPVGYPEFVHYYDSIMMTTPTMPDTYYVYQKKTDESGAYEEFTSQWSSYFFEKNDLTITLKGYKDGVVKYESKIEQPMRERDFLGIDWENGSITLANPQTNAVYCVLDTRYEFLLTDTQQRNNTPFTEIKVAASPDITDAEYLQRQVDGLCWLLTKHLGNKTAYTAADFKTLPEDASIVETYGNGTTRAALLHFKGNDLREEYYCIIAEPK